MIYTYNYCCIADKCNTKTIQITKDESLIDSNEYCKQCNNILKRIGTRASILHIGTQESKLGKGR